jgi:hypothetical protein
MDEPSGCHHAGVRLRTPTSHSSSRIAGRRRGIILSVDGIPVVSGDKIEQIRIRLASAPPGTLFKMNVLRAGKVIELTSSAQ